MTPKKSSKGPASGKKIVSSLLKGAEIACQEYIQLSGRPSPGNAPESFIQAGAARELKKVDSIFVVLEESVKKAYAAAHPPQPGPKKKAVSKGRYDIVIYSKNKKPRAAIELKAPVNALAKKKFEKDFKRLIATMRGQKDSSFRYGIYLFLTIKKGKNSSIDTLVKKLEEKAIELSKGQLKVSSRAGKTYPIVSKTDGEQGAWRISAIVFQTLSHASMA